MLFTKIYYCLLAVVLLLLMSCDVTDPKLGHNPPRNLQGEPGPGKATLTWEKPKNPNAYFSGYYIYQNTTKLEDKIENTSSKHITHVIPNLNTGTYIYYVVAAYSSGIYSEPSNIVNVIVLNLSD